MNIKQALLNICVKQVRNNLRSLDARQICEIKSELHNFNCTSKRWDAPNVRKAKVAQ